MSSKTIIDVNISGQGFDLRSLWDALSILLIDYLAKEIANIGLIEGRNHQKTAINEEETSVLSQRQCTVSQIDRNDGKATWIALPIASTPTIFSKSGPQRLLAVYRPQKNASSERDLALMKKWYQKPRRILKPKTNRSTKKAWNC